jgi:galactokinase
LGENERVLNQVEALESGDFQKVLQLIKDSGNSSFKWLQNIYSTKNVKEQGLTLALALTEHYLGKIESGACRVHGGGFAGTIQVFLPNETVDEYVKLMGNVFGEKSILVLKIRALGTVYLNSLI